MRDMTNQYEARITIQGRSRPGASQVDEYYHTDGNTYFEARQGSEFVLDLFNHSNERVVMIPAIDGLGTIDGQPAGLESPGFVVDAWSSVQVPGWSKNEHSAAHFVFWDKTNSYSNKTGRGKENVGVIGVLVFREKSQYFSPDPFPHIYNGDPTGQHPMWNIGSTSGSSGDPKLYGSAGLNSSVESMSVSLDSIPLLGSDNVADVGSISSSAGPTRSVRRRIKSKSIKGDTSIQEAGTGHGRITQFNTTEVNFEKRDTDHPDAQIVLYYDTSRGLERRGIVLKYKKNFAPDPFPNSPGYHNNTRKR